jgi:hypothetical protein
MARLIFAALVAVAFAPPANAQGIRIDPPLRPLPTDAVALTRTVASVPDFPKQLSDRRKAQAIEVATILRAYKLKAADEYWGTLVRGLKADKLDNQAVSDVLMVVLQQGVLETNAEARVALNRLRLNRRTSDAVQRYRKELQDASANVRSLSSFQFSMADPRLTLVGTELVRLPARGVTAREASAELAKLEMKLSSLGDDAELANVELQSALERHQEALRLLSNISKMLHETAKTVIQNMKA